jgi:GDP-L-fucose synthase
VDKNSKIYIAGHRGMVGSAIMRRLQHAGYKNFLVRTSEELDLRNQQQVANFFSEEKPEYVFLAAAKVGGIIANNTYRAEFIYDNLMIESNVIHQSYLHAVKKLMFLGSSCIYPKLAPQPLKEEYLLTGLLEPTNEPYAIAKIAGIKMCDAYRAQYGCSFISVMPTNLYGANDSYDLEKSHVLPALIRKMHLGKCMQRNNWEEIRKDLDKRPIERINGEANIEAIEEKLKKYGIQEVNGDVQIELWGSGMPLREFLHADDLADACYFLMKNYNEQGLVNIGTGKDLSIKELAEITKEVVGFKGKIVWNIDKPDGTPRKLMSVEKLQSLGWKYKIELGDGIEDTYKKYLKE